MAKRSTTQRGYGATHQQARRRWESKVNASQVTCPRCNQPIRPGQAWDLGHTDDRTAYTGPEHASCNRSAGGSKGAAAAGPRRSMTIREW